MSLKIRRIVTGHDSEGHALVKVDEIARNVITNRPGATSCVVWASQGFPIDNGTDTDPGAALATTTLDNGTVFRIVRYEPGVSPRNHRTDSLDYAVVMDGEIDMELDNNVVVHLKAGDVLVQRGTIHNWVNKSNQACTIAFVLINAAPASAAGKVLGAVG